MACAALGLALLLLGFASEPDKEKAAEEKGLLGAWKVVASEQSGKRTDSFKGATFVFTADTLIMKNTLDGKEEPFAAAKYKLDPTKNPKSIDLSIELDPGKPIVQPGIYQLDGDELKFCLEAAGLPRPTKFETGATGTSNLFILTRMKSLKPALKPKPPLPLPAPSFSTRLRAYP